jgi:hypothetical protein
MEFVARLVQLAKYQLILHTLMVAALVLCHQLFLELRDMKIVWLFKPQFLDPIKRSACQSQDQLRAQLRPGKRLQKCLKAMLAQRQASHKL